MYNDKAEEAWINEGMSTFANILEDMAMIIVLSTFI